jgi:DNA replication protein DnaC
MCAAQLNSEREAKAMHDQTIERLMGSLKLSGALQAYEQQLLSPYFNEMPFNQRLEHLLSTEVYDRDEKARKRLLQRAKLKFKVDPDSIAFNPKRNLEKSTVAELLTCRWIKQSDNLLISGASGTGKTYLGCAFAVAAINLGLPVRYVRTNPMLQEMVLAHGDGSLAKVRAPLVGASLLILDDFGIAPIPERSKQDLLDILDDRLDKYATMVIGQLDPTEWHDYLATPHMADAIMDRFVQRAHRISLKGQSMRERF